MYVLSPVTLSKTRGSRTPFRQQRDNAESCENRHQWAAWLRMLLGKAVSPQLKSSATFMACVPPKVRTCAGYNISLNLEPSCEVINSKAEMWFELVPQPCSDMLLLHISPLTKNVSFWGRMLEMTKFGNFNFHRFHHLISQFRTVKQCIERKLPKDMPKGWQRDACQLSLSKYHDTQRGESWIFFDLRWRLWPWQHFDSDHAREVRTGQVVQLLFWLDSKLFKTYGTRTCGFTLKYDPKIRDVSLTSGSFPQIPNCNSHEIASLSTATWPRKGSGAKCEKCPENSFTENYDSKECEQCPQGSKAPAGSISHSSCICDVGVLYQSNGRLTLCSTWQFVQCNCMFPNLFFNPAGYAKVCTISGLIAYFTQWSITSMFRRCSSRSRAGNDEPVERPDEHLNL